jgi:hypothetical protein
MRGTYHFCGEQHLQRYLNEFSFRCCNRSGLGIDDRERVVPGVSTAASALASFDDADRSRRTYIFYLKVYREALGSQIV